jgi:hypothetical protein
MSFISLKRILPQAVRQAGIEQSVSAARITEEAQAALVRLWGDEKAVYVRVVSTVGDTLKVAVTSPSAVHGLKLLETAWMNEINRALGSQHVKKITVKREGF